MTTTYDANIPYDSVINYDGGPSVVTSLELPTWQLDVTNPFTGVTSPLPEAMIDQMAFESSSVSAIGFTVALGSVGASLCGDYAIVELRANSQRVRDARWILRGQTWDEGKPSQVKQFTGRHLLWDRLEHTVVQPGVKKSYTGKTPGYILNDLFADAQARDVGFWDTFTWTFDVAKDSNGTGWPLVLGALEYLPTAKYSDIVANMVDKGVIEIYLLGNEIRVAVPSTEGRVTPALLVVGEDVTSAPQQSSVDGIVSDVVVLGDEGATVVRSNTDTRALYWREEAGISQGGTKDPGTLSVFGDVALSNGSAARVMRTYDLVITQKRPFLPLRDYVVEDWVRVQHANGQPAQSYRVKQIALKQAKGQWVGSLTLNDKFLENELRLVKKVDGIIGGATITGSSQTATPSDLKDTGKPAPMTGFALTSSTYQDDQGITRALATASWNPVTLNTDGTVANDMGTYYLVWWYTNLGFAARTEITVQHPTNAVTWSNLEPGREIAAYVYSKDNNGNQGSWNGGPVSITPASDTTAPPVPGSPWLASAAKTFVVEWKGDTFAGGPMPADFKHVEVWSSKVNNFNAGQEGLFHGTIPGGAGILYASGFNYTIGDTVYFKFIAVDNSGNKSAASGQNSNILWGITGVDINAGAINANAIQAGAISAFHITAGAITADKISLGGTMNLVQDPSFNDAGWRAQRLTTKWAENPARWFFKTGTSHVRNGYYLQALSSGTINGGRMYITDWIGCQLGESYYVGMYMKDGEFVSNFGSTMRLGVEVTLADGTVQSDGISYTAFSTWIKYGYRFSIMNPSWVKVRFFIRADNLTAGDIMVDDLEVRSGVGTTETSGSRGLLDSLGLFAWDFNDVQTFSLDFRSGDFTAKGQLQSGYTGKRTIINPSTTFLPEIRFYPTGSETYAYINAVDGGGGSIPYIGVNAPDTGATGTSLILFDDGLQLGEINKGTGQVAGGGMSVSGTGNSANLFLYGKIAGGTYTNQAMAAWRFNLGTGGGANVYDITLSKPPAAISGQWSLIYSVQRAGTGQKISYHISQNSSTTATVKVSTNDATAFTAVNLYIHFMFVRCDGDA